MIASFVKSHFQKFLGVLFLILASSCSDEEVAPVKEDNVLVSSELVSTRTIAGLQILLALGQVGLEPDIIRYDVDIYKVTYFTEYKNEMILASGLVILPKTTDEVSMLSFQHGTITDNEDAPTMISAGDPLSFLYAALASPGFIGVVPDYIGFGSSSNLMHPYYVEDLTASSVVDNMKAASELANEKGVNFDGDLFIAGYSEGGYATMATHKYLEQNEVANFNLVASFPAAGGYDVKSMQEYFFALETYENPFYIAYVAQAYKTVFDFSQPLTDFFQEPFASRIPNLFNGTLTSGEINGQLTSSITDLIAPDLRTNIDTNPDYAYLRNAFIENSLIDWAPATTMYLYHGDEDLTVPFENTEITYDQLIQNGASTATLKFLVIEGADHSTGVLPYVADIIPKMLSLN
ncbi:MAG: lipase family protein [Cyclobacteriaceae bacterium]